MVEAEAEEEVVEEDSTCLCKIKETVHGHCKPNQSPHSLHKYTGHYG